MVPEEILPAIVVQRDQAQCCAVVLEIIAVLLVL
jgi:hypothetical protein